MDYILRVNIPIEEVIPLKLMVDELNSVETKIGITHGDDIHPRGDKHGLEFLAKKMDVQILITGHTHADMCVLSEDRKNLLVNPGSISGAWSFIATGTPSFQTISFFKPNNSTSNSKIADTKKILIRVDTHVLMDDSLEIRRSEFFYNQDHTFEQLR